jgi:hypothetical protein
VFITHAALNSNFVQQKSNFVQQKSKLRTTPLLLLRSEFAFAILISSPARAHKQTQRTNPRTTAFSVVFSPGLELQFTHGRRINHRRLPFLVEKQFHSAHFRQKRGAQNSRTPVSHRRLSKH